MKDRLVSEQIISITPGVKPSDLYYIDFKYDEPEPKVMKIKEWLKSMISKKNVFVSPGIYTREYDRNFEKKDFGL